MCQIQAYSLVLWVIDYGTSEDVRQDAKELAIKAFEENKKSFRF